MNYYLLRIGDLVKDGDEAYSWDEINDKYPEGKWRPVAKEWIGQPVDSDDVPIRHLMD